MSKPFVEIERKFLVKHSFFENGAPKFKYDHAVRIEQGYLVQSSDDNEHKLVRVRLQGGKGILTYKSSVNQSIERVEIETEIGKDVAIALLAECTNLIKKVRYLVYTNDDTNRMWEVDVFEGDNEGLIVAEIELDSIGEEFDIPEWCDVEVTHDIRYNNNQLSAFPFCKWSVSIIKQAAQMFDMLDDVDDMYISWNPYMTDGFICHKKGGTVICNVSDIWKKSFFG